VSDRLSEVLARGPLILDAAMGTRLVAERLDLRDDDPCLWNLSRAEAVRAIHRRDVAAGAGAVLSNTFGANRPWLRRFGRAGAVRAVNRRAVELAREAAGPDRLVLGSIGPAASNEPESYREQAEELAGAGVDALLFETHRLDQAEAALRAVRGLSPAPLLVSLVDWPEPLGEATRRLAECGASALGVNCVPGMDAAVRLAESLRRVTGLPLIVKPSAGGPGQAPASPQSFAEAVPRLRALGLLLVGGCCGTTEAHVAALDDACYHRASAESSVCRVPGRGLSR
jgi:methionine synthase I (cobalamin-dependent)